MARLTEFHCQQQRWRGRGQGRREGKRRGRQQHLGFASALSIRTTVHQFAPSELEPAGRGRGAARGTGGRGRRATRGIGAQGRRAAQGTDGRGCRGRPRPPAKADVRRRGAVPEERRARRRGWNG
jgi:hypothetical protein